MGARWGWHAVCEAGHITSGFSGGADEFCNFYKGEYGTPDCWECNARILAEHECLGTNWECTQGTDDLRQAHAAYIMRKAQMNLPFMEE